MTTFTLEDLVRIMRECAGEDDAVDLDGDVADVEFEDLGYDSLAVMETVSRISHEYEVPLPEEAVSEARTPAELVALVVQRQQQPAQA
ncbi:acyl carrier protein [Microtetraspora malaysiensis]|uniref:acyl carrier protein n=1 Tax=Microtetraspora malaysiensis TaxID=161358 RepID=UPI003D8B1601